MKVLSNEEIKRLYPEFKAWVKKKYGYFTIDSWGAIQLWYEWIELKEKEDSKVKLPPRAKIEAGLRHRKGTPLRAWKYPDNG